MDLVGLYWFRAGNPREEAQGHASSPSCSRCLFAVPRKFLGSTDTGTHFALEAMAVSSPVWVSPRSEGDEGGGTRRN